jgi:hypothetical protein
VNFPVPLAAPAAPVEQANEEAEMVEPPPLVFPVPAATLVAAPVDHATDLVAATIGLAAAPLPVPPPVPVGVPNVLNTPFADHEFNHDMADQATMQLNDVLDQTGHTPVQDPSDHVAAGLPLLSPARSDDVSEYSTEMFTNAAMNILAEPRMQDNMWEYDLDHLTSAAVGLTDSDSCDEDPFYFLATIDLSQQNRETMMALLPEKLLRDATNL